MRLQSRVDELEAELVEADRQIQGAHAEVQRAMEEQHSSEIRLNEAGSIAEAALQINHVFEDADKAAQQYLESVRLLSEREDAIVAQREQESKEKAVRLLQKTEERCREKVAETKAKCAALEEESRIKSEAYWEKVSRQMQIFVASHQELKGLLGGFNQDMQQAKAAATSAREAAVPAREAYEALRRAAEEKAAVEKAEADKAAADRAAAEAAERAAAEAAAREEEEARALEALEAEAQRAAEAGLSGHADDESDEIVEDEAVTEFTEELPEAEADQPEEYEEEEAAEPDTGAPIAELPVETDPVYGAEEDVPTYRTSALNTVELPDV